MPTRASNKANISLTEFLESVPRLVSVTSRTAVSYALHLGANQILQESSHNDHGVREIIEGYRSDATAIVVIWLCALLDSDATMLSFQTVYRFLKEDENVEQVVAHVRQQKRIIDVEREERAARNAISRFMDMYRGIDWKDVHGRLVSFRNTGVAHLTFDGIRRRVIYNELKEMVDSAVSMSEALAFFSDDRVPLIAQDIENYARRAADAWRVVIKDTTDPEGDL